MEQTTSIRSAGGFYLFESLFLPWNILLSRPNQGFFHGDSVTLHQIKLYRRSAQKTQRRTSVNNLSYLIKNEEKPTSSQSRQKLDMEAVEGAVTQDNQDIPFLELGTEFLNNPVR